MFLGAPGLFPNDFKTSNKEYTHISSLELMVYFLKLPAHI